MEYSISRSDAAKVATALYKYWEAELSCYPQSNDFGKQSRLVYIILE
jgi:hypothetical protein